MTGLEPAQFWHWWAFGGLLMIIEVFAPGFMLLWLGVAAGLVGCLLLVWPGLGLSSQVLVFAALSVASVIAWLRVQSRRPALTDEPNLNRRGAQHVGERGPLVAAIVNGRGRIELGDSSWSVTGPDLPAGAAVEVTGAAGTVLQVQPVAGARPEAGEPPAPGAAASPNHNSLGQSVV